MGIPRLRQGRPRVVLAVAYEAAFAREADLRLVTATTTGAAAKALAAAGVDAVLLDLAVPEEGGLELCRWIRAQPRLGRLPVIALSAYPAALYAAPALAAGCTAFLQKPFSLAGIVAEVRRHLIASGASDTGDAGSRPPAHTGKKRAPHENLIVPADHPRSWTSGGHGRRRDDRER
jgi:CheY-like chemotaxis protein